MLEIRETRQSHVYRTHATHREPVINDYGRCPRRRTNPGECRSPCGRQRQQSEREDRYSNKDKIAQIPEAAILALTTPLSLSGTPEEIDAELVQQLTTFVDSHRALQRSVDEAKQQIAEAIRAIEERDRSRTKVKTTGVAKAVDTKSEQGSENKEEEVKSAPDNLSLFDAKESKIK